MNKYFLQKVVFQSWEKLIIEEKFSYVEKKSNKYLCWIENKNRAIVISIERYLDRFDIGFVDLESKHLYPRSIFTLIEVLLGVNSKLFPLLIETSSRFNENKLFYQRYFINPDNYINSDFKSHLEMFQEIIRDELDEVLKGKFDPFYLLCKKHFSYRIYEKATISEKIELDKDFDFFSREPFKFPEIEVIEEIDNQMQTNKTSNSTQYKITHDEKNWLDSIDKTKEQFGDTLSVEYISSFEKIHEIKLPRDYKLFLNYIGNGFYRFRKLEQSISNSEEISSSECFEFIDLTKPF